MDRNPVRRVWLSERLKDLGLSRADLAQKVNVSRRQVNRWISGGGAYATTRYEIALALQLPPSLVDELFTADDPAADAQMRAMAVSDQPTADGEYQPVSDEDFYRFYACKVAGAQSNVWITSDGFNMRSQTSRRYAGIMAPGFMAALSNGAVVNRYQIVETMHINWVDELIRMKSQFRRQFRVFVNRRATGTSSVCSIDPRSDTCVAEAFEGTKGGFCQGTVARGYAFHIHDKAKAAERRDVVQTAIDAVDTEELSVAGLQTLKEILFAERSNRLQAWFENNADSGDLVDSGVFDEVVISHFVRKGVVGK